MKKKFKMFLAMALSVVFVFTSTTMTFAGQSSGAAVQAGGEQTTVAAGGQAIAPAGSEQAAMAAGGQAIAPAGGEQLGAASGRTGHLGDFARKLDERRAELSKDGVKTPDMNEAADALRTSAARSADSLAASADEQAPSIAASAAGFAPLAIVSEFFDEDEERYYQSVTVGSDEYAAPFWDLYDYRIPAGWGKVSLIPKGGGETLERDYYKEGAWYYGDGAIVMGASMPEGLYDVEFPYDENAEPPYYYDGYVPYETGLELRVIGETKTVIGVGGLMGRWGTGIEELTHTADYQYFWLQTLLNDNFDMEDSRGEYEMEDDYLRHFAPYYDGSVYLVLYSANLEKDDISGATIESAIDYTYHYDPETGEIGYEEVDYGIASELKSVTPLGNIGKLQRFLLKFELDDESYRLIVDEGAYNFTATVDFADGTGLASHTGELYAEDLYEEEIGYYALDFTDIDELKLKVIPQFDGELSEEIEVEIYRELDWENYEDEDLELTGYLSDGVYIVDIPENTLLFGSYNYWYEWGNWMEIEIWDGLEHEGYQVIYAEDVFRISFPDYAAIDRLKRNYGYYGREMFSTDVLPADIDGKYMLLGHYPHEGIMADEEWYYESGRRNAGFSYKGTRSFSIADADLAPVSGVSITQDSSKPHGAEGDYFVINAEESLVSGETYYLMYGGFPLFKLPLEGSHEDDGYWYEYNLQNGYVFVPDVIRESEELAFSVRPHSGLTADEFSISLEGLIPGSESYTYAVSDGGLLASPSSERIEFRVNGEIPQGVYRIHYLRDSVPYDPWVYERDDIPPVIMSLAADDGDYYYEDEPELQSYLLVRPAPQTLTIADAGFDSDGAFYLKGFSPSASIADLGFDVDIYEKTLLFISGAPIASAALSGVTADSDGSFVGKTSIDALGLDKAGVYYITVSDRNTGVHLYGGMATLDASLLGDRDAFTLSGSVMINDAPAAGARVELWRGDEKVRETNVISGFFSFAELANGTYTVKVPAGTSWREYSEAIDVSGDTNLQIVLSPASDSSTVSGRVTLSGEALAGYTVRVYTNDSAARLVARALTDADGAFAFTLPDGGYTLKGAATADYYEYTGDISVSGADIELPDIALKAKSQIAGTVSLNGEAKSGVYVYAWGRNTASAVSDAEGKYVLKGLEASEVYTVSVDSADYRASASVTTVDGGVAVCDLTLEELVKLSGTVTLNGLPVQDVLLTLSGEAAYHYAYTDRNSVYRFNSLTKGDYVIETSATFEHEAYSASVDLNTAPGETAIVRDIALTAPTLYKVSFNYSSRSADIPLSLTVYRSYPYLGRVVDGDETSLPAGAYEYSGYYGGTWFGGSFLITNADISLDIALPAVCVVTGLVEDSEGNPAAGAAVDVANASGGIIADGRTNNDGEYRIIVKYTGSITVNARHAEKGYGSASAVIAAPSGSVDTIILKTNSLEILAKDAETGAALSGVKVYVGGYGAPVTNAEGRAVLNNIPSGEKSYSASRSNYINASGSVTVPGEGAGQLEFSLRPDYDRLFTLSLGASNSEIAVSGYVDLLPKLTYSGSVVDSGVVVVELPSGFSALADNPYAGAGYAVSVTPGSAVTLPALRVTVDNTVASLSELTVRAYYRSDRVTKSANVTLTVVNSSLNAPEIVRANTDFRVYGTAMTGSVVAIKNGDAVLATAAVSSRYFSATLNLPAGEYDLYAEAVKGDMSAVSDIVTVIVNESAAAVPYISDIDITEGYLYGKPVVNPVYGFPTFSTWVLPSAAHGGEYRGIYNIVGTFILTNAEGFSIKNIVFAGSEVMPVAQSDVSGKYKFNFPIGTWGGLGVKPIILTLTKDGREYQFTIALVTILIDPSGYVYDAVTNERIEGAEVTLEIKVGDTWIQWSDPDDLQANPMLTDEEGRYGWGVPEEGDYRVRVTAADYADAIANKADGGYDDASQGIPVPPVQTEVNVALAYQGAPTAKAEFADGELVIQFSRPMYSEATANNLTVTAGDNPVDGAFSVSDDEKVFNFVPVEAFDEDAVLGVAIVPSTQSKDNVAFGEDSIAVTDGDDPGDEEPPAPVQGDFSLELNKAIKTVRVTGEGYAPNQVITLTSAYNREPSGDDYDYRGQVTADAEGNVNATLPADVTDSLPWLGGHMYYVSLGGKIGSAPIYTTVVKAHTSARISLKARASLQLIYTIDGVEFSFESTNSAIVKVDENGLITGVRGGMAAVSLKATDGSGLTSSVMVTVSM
ncbi:MAG: carboxypeptidase regulatory-like domain-containing protein [Clostridiales Family XIII bacterium]|jgi:hypothetical protein|nr:carboxypeptidase regulatory-like domain-containing protein [Clostridiales Family XIII bacterium]